MQFTRTVKFFIGALATLVLVVAVLSILLLLVVRTGVDLTEMVRVFADEATHEQKYHDVIAERTETAAQRDEIASYILHGDADTVHLLSEIDSFAANFNVTLSTEELTVQEREDSPYAELAITMVVTGSEASVGQMISLLETLPYHSYIARLEMNREVAAAGTTVTRATLVLMVTFVEA